MEIRAFQDFIRQKYEMKDSERGLHKTFIWLVEEIGELASAIKEEDEDRISEELADVMAWTFSVANLAGKDMDEAIRKKYGDGDEG